jgi:hypothetical protein
MILNEYDFNRDFSIIGNPGCGKTRTIINFCKSNFKKSNEFLVITYSKKAQLDFINKGIKISSIFNNNNIKTFHSLASSISKKLINKNSDNINTIILATLKLIENINENDLRSLSFFIKCRIIIIDEAQDINNNQYNLMRIISNKLKIPLVLVGDPNQNIYQFQGGTDKHLISHSHENTINLIDNYRSTPEIVEFCNHLRPHNYLSPMTSKNPSFSISDNNNKKPYIYINSIDEITKHLLREIRDGNYKYHEIGIIGSVKLSKNYTSIGLQMIANLLASNNINYIKYFKDNDNNNDNNNNEKIEIKENHVNLLTIHSSKGLEFKKVIVINFHLTTFSRNPTVEDYNTFKYLWYVAFTRAIENLIIYVDNSKCIFPYIKNVPSNLYECNHNEYIVNTKINNNKIKYIHYDYDKNENKDNYIKLEHNQKQLSFPIVETINNNKYFNEDNIYEFMNSFKYKIETINLYDNDNDNDNDNNQIYEYNEYSMLYGCYVEELHKYYWYINNSSVEEYVNEGLIRIHNKFCISDNDIYDKYKTVIPLLKKKGFINKNNYLNLELIDKNKNKLNKNEIEFLDFIHSNITCKNTTEVQIIITINLSEYNKEKYTNLYKSLLNDNDNDNEKERIIFDIILYQYQIDNECIRYLSYDWSNHYNSIKKYFPYINDLTKDKPNYNFQELTINSNMNIYGKTDIINHINKNIIELKFSNTKEPDIKYILQLLLYSNNYFFKYSMEIINIYNGNKYIITIDNHKDTFDIWKFNCYLAKVLQVKMNDNIFILDIETNTIDENQDFTYPPNTEVIERFIYEYNFNSIVSQGLIKNKKTLTTSHITGITEETFNENTYDDNYDKFKDDIKEIIEYSNNPIFIAHNGNRFDFAILDFHQILNKNNIRTLDTLYLFRLFIKEKSKSNKLIDIYNNIYNSSMIQAHRAEGDVMLINDIFRKLKLTNKDITSLI